MLDMVTHQHEDCSECINDWWEWARNRIHKPIDGFYEKKNPDGTPFSLSQQQGATHVQVYWIIYDLCRRGKNSRSIQSILSAFTQSQYQPSNISQ